MSQPYFHMATVGSVETKRVFRQFQTFLNCLAGKMFLQNVAFEYADSNSLQRIFLIILYALQGCPWLSCHNSPLQQGNEEGFKGGVSDVSYSGTPPKDINTSLSTPFTSINMWMWTGDKKCKYLQIYKIKWEFTCHSLISWLSSRNES